MKKTIVDILKKPVDSEVTLYGRVKFLRKGKKFSFLHLVDGSNFSGIQVVLDATIETYSVLLDLMMGDSIKITGKLVESQGKNQSLEIHGESITLIGSVGSDYPLQKKETSMEFLRDIAHLRGRTQTFNGVFRIRHSLSFATHDFFNRNQFNYIHTPLITASDCEGAGELFRVSTEKKEEFFGRPTFLTVSGQLSAETLALAMGRVYTFGPTFRAENSNTPRHLAEFWMIEPEVSFCELDEIAQLAEDYLKYIFSYVLENNKSELEFLEKTYEEGLIEKLEKVASSVFKRETYTECINILKNSGEKFQYEPNWGEDLATEHERYLVDKHFCSPLIVTDYPKKFKPFYMKLNDDDKTVKAMDVLLPGVGEVIGGSQREDCLETLEKRMKECGLNCEDYSWYLDLRKYGTIPHSGFGLGLERAIMYATGMNNIRDVIPFPRTPLSAEF